MAGLPQTYAAWSVNRGGAGRRILDNRELDFDHQSFKSVQRDLNRRLGREPSSMLYYSTGPYDGIAGRINFASIIAHPVEEALEEMLRTGNSILSNFSNFYVDDDCLLSLISLNQVLHDHFRGQHHPLQQWENLGRKIGDLQQEILTNCQNDTAIPIQTFITSVVSLCTEIENSRDTLRAEEQLETQMLINAQSREDRERIVRNRKTIARNLGFLASGCVILFFFCNFLYCESTRFLSPQQLIGSNLPASSIEMFEGYHKEAQEDSTGSIRPLHMTNKPAFFPVVNIESGNLGTVGFYSPAQEEFVPSMAVRGHNGYTQEMRAQSMFSLVSLRNVFKYRFDYFKTRLNENEKCLIPRQLKDVIGDNEKSLQFIKDATLLPLLADICAEIKHFNYKVHAFDEPTLKTLLSKIKQSTDVKIIESKSYEALSTALEPTWRRHIFSTNFETALWNAVENKKDSDYIVKLARSFVAKNLKEIKEMAHVKSVIVFQVSDDSSCSGDSTLFGINDSLWTYAYPIWDALLLEQLYNAKSWEDRAFLLSTMPRNPLSLVSSALVFSGATLSIMLSKLKIAKETRKLLSGSKGKKKNK